ncbi:hypothetical protein BCU68_12985 [Vibrio sp. 10N.286.49.B3]|uniref:TadE/TadG family type IV pilus assembly protein n=1 Tax=Vibrio sp. 10N.286.49.B3 TaxID=1880855 RepID=UPI000C862199|nr:TadE/TadG family type IV pilus assembly protein [Vibrio sp. 10N.286.49.B3]PMH43760.1 hypothetical protein BCU68_12985 [Vibrio sp. 10N.286.49.B3]
MNTMKKQQGHAAILFVMLVPLFFGVFILASDGARALQTKARINDAVEVATLAVTARNADNTVAEDGAPDGGSEANRKLVVEYLEQYLPDIDSVDMDKLKIVKNTCVDLNECDDEKGRFYQYQITANTVHKSWFPGGDAIPGLGETFNVASSSTVRKFQSEAVDVMLVADFSGSMLWDISGDTNPSNDADRKYKQLVKVIQEVSDELERFNDLNTSQTNQMGVSVFNFYTTEAGGSAIIDKVSKTCYEDQFLYSSSNEVDLKKTASIDNIFNKRTSCKNVANSGGSFKNIPLTDEFSTFNESLGKFSPGGGTSSVQGIIRGAQMLEEGINNRRLMIVLSDGLDSHSQHPLKSGGYGNYAGSGTGSYLKVSYDLINDHGLCENVKEGLTDAEGTKKQVKLVGIGFGYDLSSKPSGADADITGLEDCVGEANLYEAANLDEVLDIILELISEEIGHFR